MLLRELNEDGDWETPTIDDADFALVVFGVQGGCESQAFADWNHDGVVNAADFHAFLYDFLGGSADYDGNRITGSDDFFAFVEAFFASR